MAAATNRELGKRVLGSLVARVAFTCITIFTATSCTSSCAADSAINIGSRLEIFVDDLLIEQITGAKLMMHQPQPREVVIVCDAPWEGNTSAYYTLFQDGELYRMYYRGAHSDLTSRENAHPEYVCYAQSRDGIHWEKPKLGLVEFKGSKENNILRTGPGSHNFTPFKDENPLCTADAR